MADSIPAKARRPEDALQASEERFRSILENMSEGLMLFDAEQNLIYQNPASLRIHGFAGPDQGQIQHDDLPATWKAWDESGRDHVRRMARVARVPARAFPEPGAARHPAGDRPGVFRE